MMRFIVYSYMFWTDWGSPGKVERAYMDGTGRTTIADTNLVWPNDITIDYEVRNLSNVGLLVTPNSSFCLKLYMYNRFVDWLVL